MAFSLPCFLLGVVFGGVVCGLMDGLKSALAHPREPATKDEVERCISAIRDWHETAVRDLEELQDIVRCR